MTSSDGATLVTTPLSPQERFTYLVVTAILIVLDLLPDARPTLRLRGNLVSTMLPGRPKGLKLGSAVRINAPSRLTLGEGVYIARGGWINAYGGIDIGRNVTLGPYVTMSSSTHVFDGDSYSERHHEASISIEPGCWIAAGSAVTAGTRVGAGSLIGANAVARGAIPERSLVTNSCRVRPRAQRK